jgi:hypothetical protein
MEGRWRQLPRHQVKRAKTEQVPWKAADSLEVSAIQVGVQAVQVGDGEQVDA